MALGAAHTGSTDFGGDVSHDTSAVGIAEQEPACVGQCQGRIRARQSEEAQGFFEHLNDGFNFIGVRTHENRPPGHCGFEQVVTAHRHERPADEHQIGIAIARRQRAVAIEHEHVPRQVRRPRLELGPEDLAESPEADELRHLVCTPDVAGRQDQADRQIVTGQPLGTVEQPAFFWMMGAPGDQEWTSPRVCSKA